MSATSQPAPFHWQQVDQRLSSILQSKVSEEVQKLTNDDVGHIRFQNMHNANSMAIPSERLQMHRLRAGESAARLYEGYCEIWQTQRKHVSPEFLRGIVANVISVVFSARTGSVIDEFVREQQRMGSDSNWLKPALEAFKRDMQMLSHKWSHEAEVDARTVQYMLESHPEHSRRNIASWKTIVARARTRTLEATIASIEARIEMGERALNGMLMTDTQTYQKRSVSQSLSHLKNERKELRSRLDKWQERLKGALLNAEGTEATLAAAETTLSESPNTTQAMESGTQAREQRPSRRRKTRRTSRKRQRPKTVPLPPYRSKWKRATKALLIENSKMSVLEICRQLDENASEIPKKWIVGENRSFEDAYRAPAVRQRIHTAISKIRADLRKTGVID